MEDKKGCLLIGEGVSLNGNITLPGTIYVYGHVSGEIVANEIHIGESGNVSGNVTVTIADIKGKLANSIRVEQTLSIRSTGEVSGTIKYQSLEIEHGGVIDGEIEKLSLNNDSTVITKIQISDSEETDHKE
ncbi:MAG: polymer-forming cytoskeletal protein [Methylotenera sp.]|uniref:bactofilin family protein n=1 Tax=Methylotenera sp. TaxID=2051956 RepID=UPI0027198C6A|nr:polymer-forming cytoskeletal protein [Methylotenera sp.]MDO9149934.1 polymer-forming cytoskeletal protein [Methylotenera sp.]